MRQPVKVGTAVTGVAGWDVAPAGPADAMEESVEVAAIDVDDVGAADERSVTSTSTALAAGTASDTVVADTATFSLGSGWNEPSSPTVAPR